jgi:hypothetical protein
LGSSCGRSDEGEFLGVTWALEKTSYHNLGCDQLLVLVEHKPLIGLLINRELEDISNPRLERTMRWQFRIEHVAGAKNFRTDALSRYPSKAGSVLGVSGGAQQEGPTGSGEPVSGESWERETAALLLEQVAPGTQVETLEEGVLANASVRAVRSWTGTK